MPFYKGEVKSGATLTTAAATIEFFSCQIDMRRLDLANPAQIGQLTSPLGYGRFRSSAGPVRIGRLRSPLASRTAQIVLWPRHNRAAPIGLPLTDGSDRPVAPPKRALIPPAWARSWPRPQRVMLSINAGFALSSGILHLRHRQLKVRGAKALIS